MKLITGVTGRTGSQIAAELLSKKEQVRVQVKNNKDANFWSERGAEIALGDFFDATSLKSAFNGVDSAYITTPP